jgi:hypothetical protein
MALEATTVTRPSDDFAQHRALAVMRCALASVAVVHLTLLMAPWQFTVPGPGLDPSWMQVIARAAAREWQWGSDIAFTYGPLGYLRASIFDEDLLGSMLLWNGLLTAAVVTSVVAVLRHVPLAGAIALYAAIAFAASTRTGRGAYLMLPLFAGALHFRSAERRPSLPVFGALAASAVYAVAYTSLLVSGLVVSAFMDASRLARRRLPLFVPAFASAVVVAFVLAGQELASLPAFLRSVREMISGYADAMSLSGSAYELVAFLATSIAALALVLFGERRRLADPARRIDAGLLILMLAAFWFVAWKSGFVRHDLHSVFSWRALATGLAVYAALRWTTLPDGRLRIAIVVFALACCAMTTVAGSGELRPAAIAERMKVAFVETPQRSLLEGTRALLDPRAWLADLRRSKESANEALRAAHPHLAVEGTVDLVGHDQGALLAHGVSYRPQPVFQAFAAYTPWLVELNRQHLRSDRAAATLLLSSVTIDNRYPLSDLGNSIIELATHYRPEGVAADYVRFVRRSSPEQSTLRETATVSAALGRWVEVGASSDGMLLRADVRPSLLGRFARLALRMPRLLVSVRLADGRERTHRIVPAIAADGFLLSPYADDASVFAAYSAGRPVGFDGKRVVAVRIDAESALTRRFFRTEVPMRFTSLAAAADGHAASSPRDKALGK